MCLFSVGPQPTEQKGKNEGATEQLGTGLQPMSHFTFWPQPYFVQRDAGVPVVEGTLAKCQNLEVKREKPQLSVFEGPPSILTQTHLQDVTLTERAPHTGAFSEDGVAGPQPGCVPAQCHQISASRARSQVAQLGVWWRPGNACSASPDWWLGSVVWSCGCGFPSKVQKKSPSESKPPIQGYLSFCVYSAKLPWRKISSGFRSFHEVPWSTYVQHC